jgi:hypothetical protein
MGESGAASPLAVGNLDSRLQLRGLMPDLGSAVADSCPHATAIIATMLSRPGGPSLGCGQFDPINQRRVRDVRAGKKMAPVSWSKPAPRSRV